MKTSQKNKRRRNRQELSKTGEGDCIKQRQEDGKLVREQKKSSQKGKEDGGHEQDKHLSQNVMEQLAQKIKQLEEQSSHTQGLATASSASSAKELEQSIFQDPKEKDKDKDDKKDKQNGQDIKDLTADKDTKETKNTQDYDALQRIVDRTKTLQLDPMSIDIEKCKSLVSDFIPSATKLENTSDLYDQLKSVPGLNLSMIESTVNKMSSADLQSAVNKVMNGSIDLKAVQSALKNNAARHKTSEKLKMKQAAINEQKKQMAADLVKTTVSTASMASNTASTESSKASTTSTKKSKRKIDPIKK